ncbi:ferredoxin [Burkholderia sola]|nr:ferredoxin [Burkholderia cenocepacia]CAG2306972.1 ferredoxin [Burkholderia cenocepacia]CAG2324740.1 ferredoxin [Burkholderia cenocepacia]CAG2325778.1 ferredoxin [Burkholderia cenocepacia]CAG2452567.1 ferredoxin [Burkholderia cenocepacia]
MSAAVQAQIDAAEARRKRLAEQQAQRDADAASGSNDPDNDAGSGDPDDPAVPPDQNAP